MGKVARPRQRVAAWRIRLIHAGRLLLLLGLLALLPSPHGQSLAERLVHFGEGVSQEIVEAPSLEAIQALDGSVARVEGMPDSNGMFEVFDQANQSLGFVVRTLPEASEIVGYRGPTEALVLLGRKSLDREHEISGVSVLSSYDTSEHVAYVQQDAAFLNQFKAMTWADSQSDGGRSIDGVSGATLTSLAMANGILSRMGVERQSLVFPNPIGLDDVVACFPDADHFDGDPIAKVFDREGNRLGYLVRTGQFADDEIGYQGPTELLLPFDTEQLSAKPQIRTSFDNEPYVGYVPQEYSFWKPLTGKSITQLASWDPEAEGVEGVSGATMTSLSIVSVLESTYKQLDAKGGVEGWTHQDSEESFWVQGKEFFAAIRWTPGDVGTIVLLTLLPLALMWNLMRSRILRTLWLVAVIAIVGVWTGNLLSLALIAGWITSGVNFQLATGLLVLLIVSIALPPTNRSNPYCNHLCPHGAIQQLVRPSAQSARKKSLPVWLGKRLKALPAISLFAVYLTLLFRPSTDVSVTEPFHAYLWQFASWGTITFAIVTLAFSAVVPMGYCRFGCPTGRLLEHVRLRSNSHQLTRFDAGVGALFLLAAFVRWS